MISDKYILDNAKKGGKNNFKKTCNELIFFPLPLKSICESENSLIFKAKTNLTAKLKRYEKVQTPVIISISHYIFSR